MGSAELTKSSVAEERDAAEVKKALAMGTAKDTQTSSGVSTSFLLSRTSVMTTLQTWYSPTNNMLLYSVGVDDGGKQSECSSQTPWLLLSETARYVVRRLRVTILHEFLATLHPICGVRRLRYGSKKIQSRPSTRF
jgi:hypothetical protein